MKFIFIDTNVCLHFTEFDRYPWYTHFDNKEKLTIVLTHPLIEELDKKKYSGKNHLKQRATNTLKKIEKFKSIESTENFKVQFFNEVISKDYIESKGLDPTDGDDKMIAAILKFSENHQNVNNVVFVSNDLGPRLKVNKFSIEAITPFDKHRLQNPESDLDKTLKKLQIENEKLKNLSPKLSITFRDNSNLIKFEIKKVLEDKKQFVEPKLELIKKPLKRFKLKDELERERKEEEKRNEKQNKKEVKGENEFLLSLLLNDPLNDLNRIREEDKIKYNQKLQRYYIEYERYLYELYEYKIMKSLTIEFQFELNNDGTVPADDIDIYIHFPDGFELYDEESYPPEPNAPKEPNRPVSPYDMMLSLPSIPNLDFPTNFNVPHEKPNISSPSIKKTNSYDVDFNVRKLKHNKIAVLNKMFVKFETYESIINFKVDYEIRCSNVREVVKGNLNFINEIKNGI